MALVDEFSNKHKMKPSDLYGVFSGLGLPNVFTSYTPPHDSDKWGVLSFASEANYELFCSKYDEALATKNLSTSFGIFGTSNACWGVG